MSAYWIVRRRADPRFPFAIRIEQDGRTLFAVRTPHPQSQPVLATPNGASQ
jgi:hypothetical protein